MIVVTSLVQFWSEWGFRFSVIGSLAAYAFVALLSGARRRSASGWWRSTLLWVASKILWLAYVGAEIAATSAVGNLSLCGSDASADEKQVVAFWAPFLLLHLGGPDNMSALTLEDNMLSPRKQVEMVLHVGGVAYAIWNNIYRGGDGSRRDLLVAAFIMLVAGSVRYAERTRTQGGANLDTLQESWKKFEQKHLAAGGPSVAAKEVEASRIRVSSQQGVAKTETVKDGEALLLAQYLFPIWFRALIDASVEPRWALKRAGEEVLSHGWGWENMCKVAEMELSLIYEVLYTKAMVAHTLRGYLIRFLSPFATTAAASLFWLHLNDDSNGRRRDIRGSFVGITYLLLGAAFAMDVVWLLRALASTWTRYVLKRMAHRRLPGARWLELRLLDSGRWRRLRHVVVYYLDPLRLLSLGTIDPVSYRRWSGTIGRFNLLRECTAPPPRWCAWLAAKLQPGDTRYLSELPRDAKRLIIERVRRILPTSKNLPRPDGDAYTMTVIRTRWGKEAVRRDGKLFQGIDALLKFGREFEEDVLVWHIATCIFLSRDKVRKLLALAESSPEVAAANRHVQAIEAVSEYLMFLVAQRRQMLPGLVLHSLLEGTRTALKGIWAEKRSTVTGEDDIQKLATILRRNRKSEKRTRGRTDEGSRLVSDGTEIASALTRSSRGREPQMLELIFNVWVDKLVYAGVRCSRESHAKQLSAGGELTTVLWIIVHHAGLFRVGEEKPKELAEKKKKKHEEEKNKAGEEAAAPMPPPVYWPYPGQLPPYGMPMDPDGYYGWMPPTKQPMHPSMEDDKPKQEKMLITEEDEDPDDAEDYNRPIEYITLY